MVDIAQLRNKHHRYCKQKYAQEEGTIPVVNEIKEL
jgi:hypothetical protein